MIASQKADSRPAVLLEIGELLKTPGVLTGRSYETGGQHQAPSHHLMPGLGTDLKQALTLRTSLNLDGVDRTILNNKGVRIPSRKPLTHHAHVFVKLVSIGRPAETRALLGKPLTRPAGCQIPLITGRSGLLSDILSMTSERNIDP